MNCEKQTDTEEVVRRAEDIAQKVCNSWLSDELLLNAIPYVELQKILSHPIMIIQTVVCF